MIFPVATAAAHPHVFIDARVELAFEGERLTGFWAEWEFDRMFTSMIVMDFRVPRDGSFSQQQIRDIEQGAFSNLQFYDYFVFVVRDGKRTPTSRVEDFTAFMRNGRIVYRFFIPYELELSSQQQTLSIQMYDNTFFTDIAFHDDTPLQMNGNQNIVARYRVRRDRDQEIVFDPTDTTGAREDVEYTGLTHPYEMVLELRRR